MRPKRRLRQGQSSRLYLRRKDHRECILNDVYHSGIWIKKMQGEEQKDELAWLKYPSRHFLYRSRFTGAYTNASFGYFDIDRQFSFCTNLNQSYDSKCITLEDYVVMPYVYVGYGVTVRDFRITKDGMVFKSRPFSSNYYARNFYRFGKNSVIGFGQSGTTFSCDIFHIVDNPQKQFDYSLEKKTHNFTTVNATPRYVCATDEGCIIAFVSGAWCTTYEITHNGARRLNDVAFEIRTYTSPIVLQGYSDGDFIAFCIYGRYLDNMNYIVFEHNIFYSTDGGASWQDQTVTKNRYWSMPTITENMYFFARKGVCYVYDIWNGNLNVYQSSGGDFTEVEIPKGFILSVVNSCGSDIANSGANTCQIKLKADASTSADISFSISSASFGTWASDAFFKDGKVDTEPNGLTFNLGYDQVYIDNPTFQSSEDNVYFRFKAFNEAQTLPDRVQEGDYVL